MFGKSQGERATGLLPNFEDPNNARITELPCIVAGDYIVHSTMLALNVRLSGSQTCLSVSRNAFYCYIPPTSIGTMARSQNRSFRLHQISVPEQSISFVEVLLLIAMVSGRPELSHGNVGGDQFSPWTARSVGLRTVYAKCAWLLVIYDQNIGTPQG